MSSPPQVIEEFNFRLQAVTTSNHLQDLTSKEGRFTPADSKLKSPVSYRTSGGKPVLTCSILTCSILEMTRLLTTYKADIRSLTSGSLRDGNCQVERDSSSSLLQKRDKRSLGWTQERNDHEHC
jgi:hypothetical protein